MILTVGDKDNFNLGYNGQVSVRIGDGFANGGVLLRRIGVNNTIQSVILVNGNAFTNPNNDVATFTNSSRNDVPILFTVPREQDIPAGTYTGTVTFNISYTQ